jgi:hypothetical protein
MERPSGFVAPVRLAGLVRRLLAAASMLPADSGVVL